MASCLGFVHVCLVLTLSGGIHSKSVKLQTDDLSSVKHKEFLPPDHIKGLKLERDGHVNADFHHEAFLGEMITEGHLIFENMDGYKKLIEIFHKVDKDNDHMVNRAELAVWIHARISEHLQESKKKNEKLFKEADMNEDGQVHWKEYLMKVMDRTYGQNSTTENTTLEEETGGLEKHYEAYERGDLNQDGALSINEFLYFLHPEHNPKTIKDMAEDMIASFDKNEDKVMTAKEFASLPEGEVDESEKEAEKKYLDEREEEFKRMDENHDGIVNLDELYRYLDPSHEQHSVNEAKYLISVSDRNHDGKLSEREMLMNYQLFTGSSMSNYAGALHDEF